MTARTTVILVVSAEMRIIREAAEKQDINASGLISTKEFVEGGSALGMLSAGFMLSRLHYLRQLPFAKLDS